MYESAPDSPSVGALLAKELRNPRSDLPAYVLMGGATPFNSSGFLGDEFAPLSLMQPDGRDTTMYAVPPLNEFNRIGKGRAGAMLMEMAKVLDLSKEKAELRDLYGRSQFGQGCLLARRLVERGCRSWR